MNYAENGFDITKTDIDIDNYDALTTVGEFQRKVFITTQKGANLLQNYCTINIKSAHRNDHLLTTPLTIPQR